MVKFGTKFRLPSHNKVTSNVKQLTYDLDLFTRKVAVSFNKPIAYFNQWKCLVLNKFQSKLQNNLSSTISYEKRKLTVYWQIIYYQIYDYWIKNKNKNFQKLILKKCLSGSTLLQKIIYYIKPLIALRSI